jgi:hypothetical protein
MRIEKKWSKMMELNAKGIYTLKDLLKHDLINFKIDLAQLWQNVLYCDLETVKGTKNEYKYTNVIWWQSLNYDNFKYHRNKLNELLKRNPNNIKKLVQELIEKKCDLLNINTTQINPLHILLKTVVSTSTKRDENRRICLVTSLNISMQKNDSILLSHTGIRYYKKTDAKVYNEIKRRYLPSTWNNADTEKQIKELAHNIRNINSNRNIKQTKLYYCKQYELFEIAI